MSAARSKSAGSNNGLRKRAVAACLAVLATAPPVLAQAPAGASPPATSAATSGSTPAPPASAPAASSAPPAPPTPTAVPSTLGVSAAPKTPRPAIEDRAGVPVTFTSTDVTMRVYIAHGDVPAGVLPDPFEKLPPLPVKVRLAPGTYTLEAESPNASAGHDRIHVEHDAPMTVEVHSGNASVKAFGGVFIAMGIVAAILGVVTIVSVAPNDSSFSRWGVGLPLSLGGVGLSGLGLGMTFLGSTEIVAPHLPPGGARKEVSLVWRF